MNKLTSVSSSQSIGETSGSLVSRLRLDSRKDIDFVPLPSPLLRKYIAYARTYVFPRYCKWQSGLAVTIY